jgi:hypothetical protein
MVQPRLKFLDEIEKELCQECIPAIMKELCFTNSMIILLPLPAFHVSMGWISLWGSPGVLLRKRN